jgi:hypothetical protein
MVTSLIRLSRDRFLSLLSASALLFMLNGCAMMPSCCKMSSEPPEPAISNILAFWDNRVRVTTDTQNPTTMLPGLAGHVVLFDEESKKAQDARGTIVIELYDMAPARAGGQPKKLADWSFETEALKKLKKKHGMGDGYTLFLPWETYQPHVKEVKLQLVYVPTKGTPHHTEPTLLALRPDEQLTIQSHAVVPVGRSTAEKR